MTNVDCETLNEREFHPAASSALYYVEDKLFNKNGKIIIETLSSCALAGNRGAQICYGTIKRLQSGLPVSDRYLLGLAWTIHKMEGI